MEITRLCVHLVIDAEEPEANRNCTLGNSQSLGNKNTQETLEEMQAYRCGAGMGEIKLAA